MELLESAPVPRGGEGELRVPASTALGARTLLTSSDMSAGSRNPGGWQGETVEIGQKPLLGRMKGEKNHFLLNLENSDAPLFC